MWPPSTVNDPFDPTTVPVVVVPSPQSIVAVKALAVSVKLLTVKLATSVLLASATPSLAEPRSIWPVKIVGIAIPPLRHRRGRSLSRNSPDSRPLGEIIYLIEARRNDIRSQPTRGQRSPRSCRQTPPAHFRRCRSSVPTAPHPRSPNPAPPGRSRPRWHLIDLGHFPPTNFGSRPMNGFDGVLAWQRDLF